MTVRAQHVPLTYICLRVFVCKLLCVDSHVRCMSLEHDSKSNCVVRQAHCAALADVCACVCHHQHVALAYDCMYMRAHSCAYRQSCPLYVIGA